MDVYLVGGAVRDQLLGRPVTERDWVVVGTTPEALESRGFRPVGKDFPVFLHPETHEEYALARTERKTGRGYHGFSIHAAPEVSLQEDLARRDLTINAMAQRPDGTLVDPFGGREDLDARLLRHVSPAFQEDPVRILRLARFSARYAALGFRPAEATLVLCSRMVANGEVDHLVPERVWQELEKALGEARPSAFFGVLRECEALHRLLPELDALFACSRDTLTGATVNAGDHAMRALDQAATTDAPGLVRWALVVQDVDRGAAPRHAAAADPAGAPEAVRVVCHRLRAPTAYRELAESLARHRHGVHHAPSLGAWEVLDLLQAADAFRRPGRFGDLLLACELDARASGLVVDATGYRPRRYLEACLEASRMITGGAFVRQGVTGPAIASALKRERINTVEAIRRAWYPQGDD
ncbi:multifunctional CCA addition/repair protein [Aquisalimonas sp.]|uniref:multifunctional CCA addition/repair protein n=1 Tax=Aquisalimonas sp. TaxID=1872621 RepID=UPI0025B99D22|nr:multifunctional CCA addition/repair protein [Aquisalimonas sp.]